MVGGHESLKGDGSQHLKDSPPRQRNRAGTSQHVNNRDGLQQLRQFKKTFRDDIERAIAGGKAFGWDIKSLSIWEKQLWALNTMDMEGSTSAIRDALLDLRNRFLQPYIMLLEEELSNVEPGSKDKKEVDSHLSRLKKEHEMTEKCEDAKEFFAWYFSRQARVDSNEDSRRGRSDYPGRGMQNSRKETPSRNCEGSRGPHSGTQARSASLSASIRSQSTIGDGHTGNISGSGLEPTSLSKYGHRKSMVETYIDLLKYHVTNAKNWKWTCKTYSEDTGIFRTRYLAEYWKNIKSDLQEIEYDDEHFAELVEDAWVDFLESYKMQLLKEHESYEGIPGVEHLLQQYKSRIQQIEDELAVLKKYGIFRAYSQFQLDKQQSHDTSTYEPRKETRDSHSDKRHDSEPVKGQTRNGSQRAQFRSPTPDQHQSKINSNYAKSEVNNSHNASLDPKKLKDECAKYAKDCDNIAKDSLVCWEREAMKTGIEQIKKLNEIDPNSEDFYRKLTPIMSEFIDWFTENGNNELKSIERRAKKNNVINETHKEVKKSLNDLIKQGTRLRSKLQSTSR